MRPSAVIAARRGANLVKHQLWKQRHQYRHVGTASTDRFERILDTHARGTDTVFLHVGLSDIKTAFGGNPYDVLMTRVLDRFESAITPGFTDYFKVSGVYDTTNSRPKHGTFGRLFLEDADYRTDDAIKSFLVRGSYRFDDCVHNDSYHPNGCFAKLVTDNVLVMDIGVPWITCSHIHYFEAQAGVPYVADETFSGVRYRDEQGPVPIQQTCSQYHSIFYSWNKPKLRRLMEAHGILESYDLNGLRLYFFRLGDLQRILAPRLEQDPWFLVTV